MKSQRKAGVLISYFNFAVSIIGNLLITPALIHMLGDDQYSLYQVMRSFGGTLLMLNLGVSSIVARSIARSHVQGADQAEKQHALAVGLLISMVLAIFAAVFSFVIHALIPVLYQNRYVPEQMAAAQQLFGLFAAASICHILTDAFAGCMIGHERFAANALIVTLKYTIRFGLLYHCICANAAVVKVARVDLLVGAAGLLALAGYSLLVLRERPRLKRADPKEQRALLAFCTSVLMQEAVDQLNMHMDPILLGWMTSAASTVTMYSSALMIFSLYHQLVSMIGGYYLARASKMVAQNASGDQLTDMLIPPGRFQAVIALGVIGGFALFGRNFIALWIGGSYLDAYGVTLILMISALIPLVQTSALSILDAQFKRMYRSVVLLLCTVLNVVLSLLLMRWIDHWGAAIGTAVSTLLGHGLLMNRFYARKIGLDIYRLFARIFCPVLLPAATAALLCVPLVFLPCTWICFFGQCVAFTALYALLLYIHYRKRKDD